MVSCLLNRNIKSYIIRRFDVCNIVIKNESSLNVKVLKRVEIWICWISLDGITVCMILCKVKVDLCHYQQFLWPKNYTKHKESARMSSSKVCNIMKTREPKLNTEMRGHRMVMKPQFFVIRFCSVFWPWPCTKQDFCLLLTEEPTNRNVSVT